MNKDKLMFDVSVTKIETVEVDIKEILETNKHFNLVREDVLLNNPDQLTTDELSNIYSNCYYTVVDDSLEHFVGLNVVGEKW